MGKDGSRAFYLTYCPGCENILDLYIVENGQQVLIDLAQVYTIPRVGVHFVNPNSGMQEIVPRSGPAYHEAFSDASECTFCQAAEAKRKAEKKTFNGPGRFREALDRMTTTQQKNQGAINKNGLPNLDSEGGRKIAFIRKR